MINEARIDVGDDSLDFNLTIDSRDKEMKDFESLCCRFSAEKVRTLSRSLFTPLYKIRSRRVTILPRT